MEKIQFENLPSTNTPINADNLNLLQDNVENEFNNITNSKIVFEQSYKSTDAQDIEIDASDYLFYEVLYQCGQYDGIQTTGKIPIGKQTQLLRIVSASGWYIGRRDIIVSSSKITISNCTYYPVNSTTEVNNNGMAVPLKITLYKN